MPTARPTRSLPPGASRIPGAFGRGRLAGGPGEAVPQSARGPHPRRMRVQTPGHGRHPHRGEGTARGDSQSHSPAHPPGPDTATPDPDGRPFHCYTDAVGPMTRRRLPVPATTRRKRPCPRRSSLANPAARTCSGPCPGRAAPHLPARPPQAPPPTASGPGSRSGLRWPQSQHFTVSGRLSNRVPETLKEPSMRKPPQFWHEVAWKGLSQRGHVPSARVSSMRVTRVSALPHRTQNAS